MSLEDAFRAVLAARLPKGHAWAAWIDGTVHELVAAVQPQDDTREALYDLLHEVAPYTFTRPQGYEAADRILALLRPVEAP